MGQWCIADVLKLNKPSKIIINLYIGETGALLDVLQYIIIVIGTGFSIISVYTMCHP